MIDILKNIIKCLILFLIGSCVYYGLEVWYRTFSFWQCGALGGICFIIIGLINEVFTWKTPLWLQSFISTVLVTLVEYTFGMICNVWLGLNYWNYSNLPYNLNGQICLYFIGAWLIISIFAIILDDILRLILFHEKFEGYKFINRKW